MNENSNKNQTNQPADQQALSSIQGKNVPSLLDNVQNWMNSGRKQVADTLSSIFSPSRQASETSIAAIIGMIFVPLLTERSLTTSVKAIDLNVNLKLLRRDPNFNGRWLAITRNGRPIIIRRQNGHLTLEKIQADIDDSDLTLLPGFDSDGHSLLSKTIGLCDEPGALIKALEIMRLQLVQSEEPDVNWMTWLEQNFDQTGESAKSTSSETASLEDLKALVMKAMSHDPALADIVMLSQIIDCSKSLGLWTEAEIKS